MNNNDVDVTESINNEIKTNSVVLYMKGTPIFPMCGFSAATAQILTNLGVKFKSVNVLDNNNSSHNEIFTQLERSSIEKYSCQRRNSVFPLSITCFANLLNGTLECISECRFVGISGVSFYIFKALNSGACNILG